LSFWATRSSPPLRGGACEAHARGGLLITAEAKGIPLVQELARMLNMKNYIVARKSAKPYMSDPW
jgi:orotate phosphoribosyltransferase